MPRRLTPFAIALLPCVLLRAQIAGRPRLDECLDAIGRTASNFRASAPGLTAEETLDQRGRRGSVEILRGRRQKIKDLEVKLPPDFQSHHVVSEYEIRETGETRALHEVRTTVTIDGEKPAAPADIRHALTTGIQSADDRTKRALLEDLEQDRLEGAVTDFGPVILLFADRYQKDYTFTLAGERPLDSASAVVVTYRQSGGTEGLTVFRDRTEDRQAVTGEIWLRLPELLPVRIVISTEEKLSKKFTIRTEGTVDYAPSPFGLVPVGVNHKQFLQTGTADPDLMVENDFRYSGFHNARAMIP